MIKINHKALISTVALVGAFILSSKSVNAYWTCESIYGGGQKCYGTGEIMINKMVINPSTKVFVENLVSSDPRFLPSGEVKFKLEVKNVGNEALENVFVKDVFPKYLDFVSGVNGWDANTREISFIIDKLEKGEAKTYEITAKIFATDKIAEKDSIICLSNYASARKDIHNDDDTAQYCVELKKIEDIKKMPATGMDLGLQILIGLIASSLIGAKLAFTKKSA